MDDETREYVDGQLQILRSMLEMTQLQLNNRIDYVEQRLTQEPEPEE